MSKRRNLRRTARNTRVTARNTAATTRAVNQQTAMQARLAWNDHTFRYDTDPKYRAWIDEQERKRQVAAAAAAARKREQRVALLRVITFGKYPPRLAHAVTARRVLTGPTLCRGGCGAYVYPGDASCPKCGAIP